eukprot:m.41350 g.41350  ORF g.41350 m.41350 type:complete len:410 (-) comp6121_c0_seq2:23-1252(-)
MHTLHHLPLQLIPLLDTFSLPLNRQGTLALDSLTEMTRTQSTWIAVMVTRLGLMTVMGTMSSVSALPPPIGFQDNFNREDGTLGPDWRTTLQISNNQVCSGTQSAALMSCSNEPDFDASTTIITTHTFQAAASTGDYESYSIGTDIDGRFIVTAGCDGGWGNDKCRIRIHIKCPNGGDVTYYANPPLVTLQPNTPYTIETTYALSGISVRLLDGSTVLKTKSAPLETRCGHTGLPETYGFTVGRRLGSGTTCGDDFVLRYTGSTFTTQDTCPTTTPSPGKSSKKSSKNSKSKSKKGGSSSASAKSGSKSSSKSGSSKGSSSSKKKDGSANSAVAGPMASVPAAASSGTASVAVVVAAAVVVVAMVALVAVRRLSRRSANVRPGPHDDDVEVTLEWEAENMENLHVDPIQ